jgi:hypothetical protein
VKNVLAAGGCDLEIRGRMLHATDPHIVVDPSRYSVPALVKPVLGLLRVEHFLRLTLTSA